MTANLRPINLQELRQLLAKIDREQNKIQELLSYLGYALRSIGNIQQLLELVPLIASTVTDADGSILILFQHQNPKHLQSVHCIDRHDRAMQSLPAALERAYHQGYIESEASWDRIVGIELGFHTQVFGAPILLGQGSYGRLYVYSRDQSYTWNQTRQRLVRLIADQTALGLENTALALMVQEKKRQDQQLEISAEIQHQLFPHNFPQIPGVQIAAKYYTADRVGGDYYDFIPIPTGNRWAFVIGDVMGKGVPAGLIMTMTRGMLRSEVLNGHGPARILEHLNQIMYDDLDRSRRFVTLFYSEYDVQAQTLTYSNAAHMPALLWRYQMKTLQTLDTIGSIIGLAPNSEYEQAQVQLFPGDVVFFYTDGITDAANPYGVRFDEENLRLAIQTACTRSGCNAESILEEVFQTVHNFIGHPQKTTDDMTLMVLQIQR